MNDKKEKKELFSVSGLILFCFIVIKPLLIVSDKKYNYQHKNNYN